MQNKYFVEDCSKLKVGQIKTIWPELKETSQEAILRDGLKIRYRERKFEGERFLDITYCVNGKWQMQEIKIDTWPALFGWRRFWVCKCRRLCTFLYMRPDHPNMFACRDCLNLKYNLSYLNKHTKSGKVFYNAHRLNKLMEQQGSKGRLFYRNKGTKKAIRFINSAKKFQSIS